MSISNTLSIEIRGETIHLLPEKAFYWPGARILGFSDLHLGKAESLQKFGIPLPSAVHSEDFRQIARLIETWQPEQIFILGDFIHQKNSWTDELFQSIGSFLTDYQHIRWTLILGNHERGSLPILEQLPMTLAKNSLEDAPFAFTHGHLELATSTSEGASPLFAIEGHTHPVLSLSDGPLKLRFPCFELSEEHLLLPSFGVLTGGFEIPLLNKNRYFAVSEKDIFEVDLSAKAADRDASKF